MIMNSTDVDHGRLGLNQSGFYEKKLENFTNI